MQLLGLDGEDATLARQRHGLSAGHSLEGLLTTFLDLSDADVLRVLTCVMAETLEAGTHLSDVIGSQLGTDMTTEEQDRVIDGVLSFRPRS